MKNILILNFGTTKDIINSSHLISSLRNDYPTANIEMATYKKHHDLTEILSHISNVHFIDSKMIQNTFENPLYSDGFGVNQFSSNIQGVLNTQWDNVINYSNDNVSAFLINSLDSKTTTGTNINANGMASCSDKWSLYQNYVLSNSSRHAIDQVTVRNHMINSPLTCDMEKIHAHPDYTLAATQNFARIRQMKGSAGTFVVGINLAAGYDGYAPNIDTLVELIEAMEESTDYKPVLLMNGKSYQKQIANKLNQTFNNSLISINIEYIALPSVLTNIDAVISPANDQLMIADIMETKCIELRDGSLNNRTPGVIHTNNYTVYSVNDRSIASDCLLALNEEFGTELPISSMSSDNPVYRVIADDYGHLHTQIRGVLDIQAELRYHVERSTFFHIMGYPENVELFDHIKANTERTHLLNFVGNLKSDLTSTVKVLLATLRSLKGVKNSQNNLNSFITYLDNLILTGQQDSIVGSIVRNFEGRIENITESDTDTNIKAIETNLFQLKGELQNLTGIMTTLSNEQRSIDSKPTLSTDINA